MSTGVWSSILPAIFETSSSMAASDAGAVEVEATGAGVVDEVGEAATIGAATGAGVSVTCATAAGGGGGAVGAVTSTGAGEFDCTCWMRESTCARRSSCEIGSGAGDAEVGVSV